MMKNTDHNYLTRVAISGRICKKIDIITIIIGTIIIHIIIFIIQKNKYNNSDNIK